MLAKEISTVEMGILGKFVLILFYSYGGNPKSHLILKQEGRLQKLKGDRH